MACRAAVTVFAAAAECCATCVAARLGGVCGKGAGGGGGGGGARVRGCCPCRSSVHLKGRGSGMGVREGVCSQQRAEVGGVRVGGGGGRGRRRGRRPPLGTISTFAHSSGSSSPALGAGYGGVLSACCAGGSQGQEALACCGEEGGGLGCVGLAGALAGGLCQELALCSQLPLARGADASLIPRPSGSLVLGLGLQFEGWGAEGGA